MENYFHDVRSRVENTTRNCVYGGKDFGVKNVEWKKNIVNFAVLIPGR